ncbi:MAG: AtpZ/AtpI family protein [bacterium]|nr:AtpZ/AtpI family protein [bacterium]
MTRGEDIGGKNGENERRPMSPMIFVGVITGLGWLLIASAVGSFFLGYWLDRWLGTMPLFTLSLSILGTTAGSYKVIVDLIRLGKRV